MNIFSDVTESMRGDYPQPKCPVCGRFARRSAYGTWEWSCDFYYEGGAPMSAEQGGWVHD